MEIIPSGDVATVRTVISFRELPALAHRSVFGPCQAMPAGTLRKDIAAAPDSNPMAAAQI